MKPKSVLKRLAWIILPHHGNQYQPVLIRVPGLVVLSLMLLGSMMAYSYHTQGTFNVLAYATNVSVSDLTEETNVERLSAGEGELVLNLDLSVAAQRKAEHMIENNYWAHVSPDGTTPWDFINQTGITYSKAGENLAYGFRTSDGVVEGWMNSPSHRENLLDRTFTDVGFGIAHGANYQGQESTVVVAMYARPLSAGTPVTPAEIAGQTPPATQANTVPQTVVSNTQNSFGILGAIFTGEGHWSLYMTSGILITLMGLYIIRHAVALYHLVSHGRHYLHGHPILEASLVYGAIWFVIFGTYGAVL